MYTVGIIGRGFVGSAIHRAYERVGIECVVRDPAKGFHATIDDMKHCVGIFVAVPSPQREDGSCDTSILESVMGELKDFHGVIISKVTAPPDVYTKLQAENDRLVYAPEFLTAANADQDYINSTFLVVGGQGSALVNASSLIKLSLPKIETIRYCTIEEASMMKYTINTFLSTKLIFMNELFLLCHREGIDYSVVADLIKLDDRIGKSHLQVPGPDSLMGFGGACFPKDTSALLEYASRKGQKLSVLQAAVSTNKKLRTDD